MTAVARFFLRDPLLHTAAFALASSNPLSVLNCVALRGDAPSLALRGIAMAQLGDLGQAQKLLKRAAVAAWGNCVWRSVRKS